MTPTPPRISQQRNDFPSDARVLENVTDSLEELFFIEHPQYKQKNPDVQALIEKFISEHSTDDCWIYYPSENVIVHTVSEETYFRLRTARNRNIITEAEQKKYRNLNVGIAGLSVGSAILSAMAISGGPQKIKIADFDVIEVTNLNRIRASLLEIGQNKAHVAARKVWEIDPFAKLTLFDQGINTENIEGFITQEPRLDVFVDEMDSINLKIISRMMCRTNRIPVLMATDNGDGIILDVERFDLEPNRPLFHGLTAERKPEELTGLSYKDWLKLATEIVGPEYLTEAMQDSLLSLGSTIPSVPQLGTSAAIAGSAISFALRRIAAGAPHPSGRYQLGLEEKLIPGYASAEQITLREKKTQAFKDSFSK
jgi:hypothetical protein